MEGLSVEDQISHLNQARRLADEDPNHIPLVVKGILPIAQSSELRLRRWCSDFLVDCFTVKELDDDARKNLAVQTVETCLQLLKDPDYTIQKNMLMCSASIYPLIFLYVCEDQGQVDIWKKLMSLKASGLELWNSEHFGVQAACIKFVQKVVLVQSYGPRDPRLADSSDISMSSAPSGHALIDPTLEAEAQGLLERLLYVFSEEIVSAPKITCTINCVGPLLKSRPTLAATILRSILSFDSSAKRMAPGVSDSRAELEFKFIDKSLKVLLGSVLRQNVAPKFAVQIQRYLSTVSQGRASEKLRKRIAETQEDDSNKRVKLEQSTMPVNDSTTMPPGLSSYTNLFNLLSPNDPLLFDAKELPPEIAVNLVLAGIASANQDLFNNSVKIVQARYKSLQEQAPALQPNTAQFPVDSYGDDNDDFDPKAIVTLDATENDMVQEEEEEEDELDLMPASEFSLPVQEKLSQKESDREVARLVERLISYSNVSLETSLAGADDANKGLNRVALSDWKPESWIVLASRVLTRGLCSDDGGKGDIMRDHIFKYAMGNFRDRIEIIVTWLSEEWYNEYVRQANADKRPASHSESQYYKWAGKILDQVVPLLEMEDSKLFIRLLSDLPELDFDLIHKLKSLCIDPDRGQVGFRALKFLIMLRPPAKQACLDLIAELYRDDPDSRPNSEPILKRYRPEAVQA